jgi:hypothetical protein
MAKRKVEFLRTAFKKLRPLHSFAAEGLAILSKIGPIFDQRNDLVHGAVGPAHHAAGLPFVKEETRRSELEQ